MKKFLLILVSLILTLTALCAVGCGKEPTAPTKKPDAEVKTNPLIVLNDFENQKDLDTIHLRGYLGKAKLQAYEDIPTVNPEVVPEEPEEPENPSGDPIEPETPNENEEPATPVYQYGRGEHCLKVFVEAKAYASSVDPQSIYQECNLKAKGLNYTDFTFTSDITFDIYNANKEVRAFKFQLVYELKNGSETITEVAQEYQLQPAEWTKVRYTIDRAYIPEVDGISYVKAVLLCFQNPADDQYNVETGEGRFDEYYVDNICLYKTTVPFTTEARALNHHKYSDEYQVLEVCSFDSLWQVKNLSLSYPNSVSVTWCKDITVDGIGGSLRIDTIPGPSREPPEWPAVEIHRDIFSTSSSAVGKAINIADDTDDNDELVFNWYMPGEGLDNLSVTLNSSYDRLFSSTCFEVEGNRGHWNEFRVSIAMINDHLEANEIRGVTFDSLKTICFSLGRAPVSGSVRSVYIDNVRIVVNPNK